MMYVRVLGDVGPILGKGGGNQRGSPFKERCPFRPSQSVSAALEVLCL